ncbi:hypothetical protein [Brevundimonas sp. GN22]
MVHVTARLAVRLVTAVWFSFTDTDEAVAPAPPLGPVILGAAAVMLKVTLAAVDQISAASDA